MIPYSPLEIRAYNLAATAHKSQKYGKHPYIRHPVSVRRIVRAWGFGEIEGVSALLHDVVEDTNITPQELYDRGFSLISVWTVDCLSLAGGTREQKIQRAMQQPASRVVKKADASDNEQNCIADGDMLRALRYGQSILELSTPPFPSQVEVADFINAFSMDTGILEQKLGDLMVKQSHLLPDIDYQQRVYGLALQQRMKAEAMLGI